MCSFSAFKDFSSLSSPLELFPFLFVKQNFGRPLFPPLTEKMRKPTTKSSMLVASSSSPSSASQALTMSEVTSPTMTTTPTAAVVSSTPSSTSPKRNRPWIRAPSGIYTKRPKHKSGREKDDDDDNNVEANADTSILPSEKCSVPTRRTISDAASFLLKRSSRLSSTTASSNETASSVNDTTSVVTSDNDDFLVNDSAAATPSPILRSNAAAATTCTDILYRLCSEKSWYKAQRQVQQYPLDAQYVHVSGVPSSSSSRPQKHYETPLSVACRHKPPVKLIKALLQAHPPAAISGRQTAGTTGSRKHKGIGNYPDDNEEWPLHIACRCDAALPVVEELLVWTRSVATSHQQQQALSRAVSALWQGRDTTESNYAAENFTSTFWQKMHAVLQAVAHSRYGPPHAGPATESGDMDMLSMNAVEGEKGQPKGQVLFVLHAAVSVVLSSPTLTYDAVHKVLEFTLSRYPEQINQRDHNGQLPLHIALLSAANSIKSAHGRNSVTRSSKTSKSLYLVSPTHPKPSPPSNSVMALIAKRPAAFQQHQQRRFVIARLIKLHREAAHLQDPTQPLGRFPLHTSLISGMFLWHSGVKEVFASAPQMVWAMDPQLGLYPFQLAATIPHDRHFNSKRELLETIFHLLRAQPGVIKLGNDSGRLGRSSVMSSEIGQQLDELSEDESIVFGEDKETQKRRVSSPSFKRPSTPSSSSSSSSSFNYNYIDDSPGNDSDNSLNSSFYDCRSSASSASSSSSSSSRLRRQLLHDSFDSNLTYLSLPQYETDPSTVTCGSRCSTFISATIAAFFASARRSNAFLAFRNDQ